MWGKKPNQLLGPHEPDKSKCRDFYSLCVSLNACEEIGVSTVLFVDPGDFVLVAEVVEADQFFLLSFSYQREQSFVPGFQGVGRDFRGEYGVTVPDGFQLLQTVENASLDGFGVSTVLGQDPVEVAVVEPAWISCFGRIGFVGVVIELSDLVSASKYRDSREGKKESMKGYIVADSAADTVCIAFVVKTFDSCKRCSCTAELRFFSFRIYVDFTPGKGIREGT